MASTPGPKENAPAPPGAAAPTEQSAVRRNTPGALAPASTRPTVPPKIPPRAPPPKAPLPSAVLAAQRGVVQGARRPGDPAPAPPPPSALALPKLPKPESVPPPPAPASDDLDIDVDEMPDQPPKRISSSPPKGTARGSPLAMPAICTYGRFEILGRIAFGGMAEIFLGRETTQVGATRLLAIKRILAHVADDAQFVEMFLDEARLAIQLNHPHICHIYEFGELEGSYFIAMEWIHGAQLGKIIRRARQLGGLKPEIGAKIIALVAEALHYAHKAKDATGTPLGIVHRDVSPHNVMVSYDGQVKLLDFGIAKAGSHTTKTQAGVVKGKFAYMSPQQCLGKPIDARADVFALGICLYETLTGDTLYNRSTEYETMRAVIEDPVPSIRDKNPELPIELDAIVQKALQKKPDDRFRSAGEMVGAIEDWLASAGKAATTTRIADVMEKLFEDQIAAGPLVDSTPFGQSFSRRQRPSMPGAEGGDSGILEKQDNPTVATSPRAKQGSTPTGQGLAAEPRRGRGMLWGVLAVVAVLAAGGVLALRGGGPPPQATQQPATPPPVAEPVRPPDPPPDPRPPEPAVVAPAAPAEGTILVEVEARGATVRVGDRTLTEAEIGRPVMLPAGTYLVHVETPSHRPYDREVEVPGGQVAVVEVELIAREHAPAAPPGRLSINTRPWSKVYVGQRLLGTTPIGEASVPSGSVRLRIVDRDGRTFQRTVRVQAGQEESVFFDLDHP